MFGRICNIGPQLAIIREKCTLRHFSSYPVATSEHVDALPRPRIEASRALVRCLPAEADDCDAMLKQFPEAGTSFENSPVETARQRYVGSFGRDDLRQTCKEGIQAVRSQMSKLSRPPRLGQIESGHRAARHPRHHIQPAKLLDLARTRPSAARHGLRKCQPNPEQRLVEQPREFGEIPGCKPAGTDRRTGQSNNKLRVESGDGGNLLGINDR